MSSCSCYLVSLTALMFRLAPLCFRLMREVMLSLCRVRYSVPQAQYDRPAVTHQIVLQCDRPSVTRRIVLQLPQPSSISHILSFYLMPYLVALRVYYTLDTAAGTWCATASGGVTASASISISSPARQKLLGKGKKHALHCTECPSTSLLSVCH